MSQTKLDIGAALIILFVFGPCLIGAAVIHWRGGRDD